MNQPSSQLVEQPDRLLVRHTGMRRIAGMVVLCLVLVGGFFVFLQSVPQHTLRFSALEGSWALALMIAGSGLIAVLFAVLMIPAWFTLSMDSDGWVRYGWAAWRFPGPMNVRGVTARTRGGAKALFELAYGAASLRLGGCASVSPTEDLALQMTRWARSRIGGSPDTGLAHGDNFMGRWSWGYGLLFVVVLYGFWMVDSLGSYYLNVRAAPSGMAWGAAAGFAAVVFAGASWHWLRMAGREIKTGARVWLLDVLAVLLLIVPGSITALRWGQTGALRTQPAQEVTLRQTVPTWMTTGSKGSCARHVRIDEPSLGRSIVYDTWPCQGWKDRETIEVRQTQSELGVRILDVRRVETP
jgi:hypothetical protein